MINAFFGAMLRPRTLGALLGAACLVAAHTAQATQVCPSAPVPGVSGPITNGSFCTLVAVGSTVEALYVGGSAGDEDALSLPGSGNGVIFDNRSTPVGMTKTLTGVTANETLNFTLTNVSTGDSFIAAVGYENSTPAYGPVYHFAYFDFTSDTAYDAIFGASGPLLTPGEMTTITNNGGFSDWTFVSVEDLTVESGDDWNDLVYAFQDIVMPSVPVPEPSSMAVFSFAMLALPMLRRRARSR